MSDYGTLKYEVTVGRLLRKTYMESLQRICFQYNLKLEYDEHKGWLDSTYFIRIEGDGDGVREVIRWNQSVADEYE